MANSDLQPPTRSDPIFDELGNFTPRYSEFFDRLGVDNNTISSRLNSLEIDITQAANAARDQSDSNTDLMASLVGSSGKIQAINGKQQAKISDLLHMFAGLDGSNGKLWAMVRLLGNDIRDIQHAIAALNGDTGKLWALVSRIVKGGLKDNIIIKSADHTQSKYDDYIIISGTQEVTLIDPALAHKSVVIGNKTGSAATLTVTASVGTTETTSLTDDQVQRLLPVGSVWINVD